MNEPFVRQQESFDINSQPKQKKGCGCGTALLAFLGCIVAVIAAIWIIIMHTSVPLRFVADLIEDGSKGSNLKLSGLSGSLSSGLSFKKVTWNDGEITDMRFRYSGLLDVINRHELIIHEMHIGSATIHYDSQSDPAQEADDPATSSSGSPSTPTGSSAEPPLKLLQIDRVSLNKIIIKDRATGKTIDIPKIEWTGFRAKKGSDIEFGNLFANSDHLVVTTSDPVSADYQKRFEITLFPKLDERILKPINIDALVGNKDGKDMLEITAFDKSVVQSKDRSGKQQIIAKDVNLTEYFDLPLPNKLNLNFSEVEQASGDSIFTMNPGSFTLGTKTFEIQPSTNSVAKDTIETFDLSAISKSGETEIRLATPFSSKGPEKSLKFKLTSTPEMNPENLMAFIFHDREFSALDPAAQEKIRKDMKFFTFAD